MRYQFTKTLMILFCKAKFSTDNVLETFKGLDSSFAEERGA